MKSMKVWSRISAKMSRKNIPLILPSLASNIHSQFQYIKPGSYDPTELPLPQYFADRLTNRFYSETTSLSSNSDSRRCWNCKSGSTSELFLVCDTCRCIQPVDPSLDYFLLFGLERKYEIEEDGLERKYKDWQKKLHPDLVHLKSETERDYAAEQSSRIIDSYRTLSNSLSRAIYLMKLQGVHVDEEQTVSDPDVLAEIMEIRESVEDAADSEALKKIQAQVQEKMKQWIGIFARAFNSQAMKKHWMPFAG